MRGVFMLSNGVLLPTGLAGRQGKRAEVSIAAVRVRTLAQSVSLAQLTFANLVEPSGIEAGHRRGGIGPVFPAAPTFGFWRMLASLVVAGRAGTVRAAVVRGTGVRGVRVRVCFGCTRTRLQEGRDVLAASGDLVERVL